MVRQSKGMIITFIKCFSKKQMSREGWCADGIYIRRENPHISTQQYITQVHTQTHWKSLLDHQEKTAGYKHSGD